MNRFSRTGWIAHFDAGATVRLLPPAAGEAA
jgi:hypothetical protein